MSARLTSTSLCLLLLLLWNWLDILRLESAELLFLAFEESLVPYDDRVELLACDQHIVKLFEGLVLLIHHSQDPQAVTLDLLNEVTIEVKCLKLG